MARTRQHGAGVEFRLVGTMVVFGKEVITCGVTSKRSEKHKQMHGNLSNKMLDDVIDNDVFSNKYMPNTYYMLATHIFNIVKCGIVV